jgi:hypothetical protein
MDRLKVNDNSRPLSELSVLNVFVFQGRNYLVADTSAGMYVTVKTDFEIHNRNIYTLALDLRSGIMVALSSAISVIPVRSEMNING